MRYTLFGRTGLRVSELALGTMTFGTGWGWGTSEEEAARIFDAYAEAGGNFIDTANVYTDGDSERYLARLLKGRRDAFLLATKYTCAVQGDGPNTGGSHRKSLVTAVEASLRRLETDRIDVLYVHARDLFTPVEETMRALDDQVRAGKVLYVAVSDWPAWEIARADALAELRGWSPFAGVQLRLNLLERSPERELLPMADALDLAVVGWGPLAEGRLTGKYLRGEGGRRDTFRFGEDHPREEEIIRTVVAVAEEGGWTPAQVALAWLRTRPGTVIPLLGATRAAQLQDNLGALGVELDAGALARLDGVSRIGLGFPHDFLSDPVGRQSVYGAYGPERIDDRRRLSRSAAAG
ncbi:aldo/keto reductase [Nocardiopsis sp. CNT-189]|uniref:aldo/keto reductase n=1 Tax=Nocardiopsis oceanisediminis TaxID=2816862 RepID=UPI003B2F7354